jgi:patatin-like phospholipase/acyl hydrolase
MFKILSIDGGGIKGVFPATFLKDLEERSKVRIADYFDLIVGTSTGGIIALGLGLGLSAEEILNFYEEYGPKIFKKPKSLFQMNFLTPKHDLELLEKYLKAVFKDKKIGHSTTRLLIPSLNTKTGEPYIYKTAHHKAFHTDYKVKAFEAALSTTSAPLFFKSFKSKNGTTFIDGGIWANNPILVSVIEATTCLKQAPKDIKILSLGCTTSPMDFSNTNSWGLQWLLKLPSVFTSTQSIASLNMTKMLIKEKNIIRVDQLNGGPKFDMDDVKNIETLRSLGLSKAREKYSTIQRIFLKEKSKRFKPVHQL